MTAEKGVTETNRCNISFLAIHEVAGLMNFLVDSEKRKNLLLLLREGSKTLDEIRESLKVTSSGIIPQIRKMEERHLTVRLNGKYELTGMGNIIGDYFCNFEQIEKIFKKNMKFWDEHRISAIPREFRLRLHELGNYEIIRSTPSDIFKPHQEEAKNLMNASFMKGVSSLMHPDYPWFICDLAEKGMDVSIIIPDEIFDILKKTYIEEVKRCSVLKNICILLCHEKIDLALVVTDSYLSLRLFKDGSYDFYEKIMSFDKSAIRWGEDIFNYYVKRSEKIVMPDT